MGTKYSLFRRKRFHSGHRGNFNTERCIRCRLPFHPERLFARTRSLARSPLYSSLFPILFRSCFGLDTVLGMFEPAAPVAGEKREGVRHMPEGLAGLRTHRNRLEIPSRRSQLQSSCSLLVPQTDIGLVRSCVSFDLHRPTLSRLSESLRPPVVESPSSSFCRGLLRRLFISGQVFSRLLWSQSIIHTEKMLS